MYSLLQFDYGHLFFLVQQQYLMGVDNCLLVKLWGTLPTIFLISIIQHYLNGIRGKFLNLVKLVSI